MLKVKDQEQMAVETADSPEESLLSRKDLLDTDTLSPAEVNLILDQAEQMRELRTRRHGKVAVLRGSTLVTLFYEQSTRTRASFEVAGKAMGADVVNVAASSSSVAKGESLIDTVRTLEAIGADAIVVRHGSSGAPYLAARHTKAHIINGGDGTHAHPTQALLDLFTMRRHLGSLEGKKVAIIGDVRHSRVARSNLWLLQQEGVELTLCGPATLLPRTLGRGGESAGLTMTTNVEEAITGADVVMALRMQQERQQRGLIPSLRDYINGYQINAKRLSMAKPDALVLHPGPRNEGVEVTAEVAQGNQSVIEDQVTNGVAVRMAILFLMMARSSEE